MNAAARWDIFCNVVDNFGDIGVCWRLARQLRREHGLQLRLWVDDLASFARLCPGLDQHAPAQLREGVEIRHWAGEIADPDPGAVVVEAFACETPAEYLAVMAQREPRPVWVNLEYLSAEDWVDGCHGLASRHPRLPLTKYFFFPGFRPTTGGVILEAGLLEHRRRFQADSVARTAFWEGLGLPPPLKDEWRVSLFSYANPALEDLLGGWADGPRPVTCLVFEGTAAAAMAPGPGPLRRGRLTLHRLPFLEQPRYDRLLWACDWNFVRGEDSFIRAQLAGRPFLWHIYPQQGDAHWTKLQAFLGRYLAGADPAMAAALRTLWESWNRGLPCRDLWLQAASRSEALQGHGEAWADILQANGDLAGKLVKFCASRLK